MCPQERVYRHQLPDGRLTESYTALTVGLVLISRLVVRKSSADEMGVYQALSGLGGRLLPVAFLLALLRQNVGLYNFFVFREICYPVELAPSKRYV